MMVLLQLSFENLQAWTLWSLSGWPAPMLNCTWTEEFSLCISFSHNLSIYNQDLFSLLCASVKSLAPLSNYLSFRHRGAAVQPSEAVSCPGWTSWTSSASPYRSSASNPDRSSGLCWTYCSLSMFSVHCKAKNWMLYSRCSLMSTK